MKTRKKQPPQALFLRTENNVIFMALTQEELLRQQQEKLAGIAQQQQMAQQRTPGQVVGETPEQFAAGKAAANSQAAGYNLFQQRQTVAAKPQPTQQPQPVVQQTAPVKTTPVVDPNSATSGMDAVIANMYTSPEQEEKMRKASVANQRILALGDALRHIGNIYHTVNYAPSQQFNKPWEEEQTRYEKGKAVRDAANAHYLSYQQAKAAQDAKQKQWEADFQLKLADMAGKEALRKSQMQRQGTLAELDRARAAGVISENEYKKLRNEWFPKVQQATIRQKDASAAASRTRAANDTKRTGAYVNKMNNSGGGRGSNPYLYAAPNGGTLSLPRSLNSVQIDQIVTNPDFKKYRNRSALQEAMIQAGVQTNDPAQVRRYEAAMMIAQHPDVAEWAAGRFGGSVNGMQVQPQVAPQSGMNGYIAPGNTWSQPGGNIDWSQYLANIASQDNAQESDEYNWDEYEVEE